MHEGENMFKLKIIFIFSLIFSACIKERVTKLVPTNPISPRTEERQQEIDGTINGGGGKGVICSNNKNDIIETLDLYEARVLYNLEIVDHIHSEEEAFDLFASLMTNHFWNPDSINKNEYLNHYKKIIKEIYQKNIRFIDSTKKLKLVNDSFEPLVEKGCQIVQVAINYDESIILVDQSLWEKMDSLNKISLIAHEIIYGIDRQDGSTNSMTTRKLVGQIFSKKGARPKADGIPFDESKYLRCLISKNNFSIGYFFAYESNKENRKGLELVFNFIKNHSNLFRTSAFLKDLNLHSLKDKSYKVSIRSESDIFIDSYSPNKRINFEFTGENKGKIYLLGKSLEDASPSFDLTCQ